MPVMSQQYCIKGWLVLLVIGIISECVLLMLKFEPEEEQLSWLCSTRRNREPLKCIWVSKAGRVGAHRDSRSQQ